MDYAQQSAHGQYHHPLILKGFDPSKLLHEARRLAASLNCADPDPSGHPCGVCGNCRQIEMSIYPYWLPIEPQGKSAMIQIGQIRELILWLMSKAPDGQSKVAVIQEAHRMNEASQNCLLKTLEEPPAYVQILLLTGQPRSLLPTVASRCRIVTVDEAAPEPQQADGELVWDVMSSIREKGYTGVFEKAAFVEASRKQRLPDFFAALEAALRDTLIERMRRGGGQEGGAAPYGQEEKIIQALRQVWEAAYLLERNVNQLLILENLFLGMKKLLDSIEWKADPLYAKKDPV
ncbi:MAG: hypothetical protein FWF83_02715 [Clostridiales bacterium]|nr:hypothetical protein [Clostridiales bacterium]